MQLTPALTQNYLTRQELLEIWLRRNKRSKAQLARFADVEEATAGRWVRAERLPTWRVNQMRAFGIPEELLPRAEDIASGPRKKLCRNSANTP